MALSNIHAGTGGLPPSKLLPTGLEIHLGLRHVRAFLVVAGEGSTSRASETLCRTQSAVSRSIRKLEDELGIALFERRARGMLLTEYGRALLARAQRVHSEMQHARTDLAAFVDEGGVHNAAIFELLTHERRVRAFVALTEQHHMPSVAEGLGITQPAVSMIVRQLEESIGIALFERTARGMTPTPAGAALALRLKRASAEIRHALADIASLRGVMQGTVTVGAPPLGRTNLLPEAIAEIVAKYPGLRVATIEGSTEMLEASLRAGDIDFIIGALRPGGYPADIAGVPLADDELGIVCRPEHPWARRKHIPTRELTDARWVAHRLNAQNCMALERALNRRGLPAPSIAVETSDLALLRSVLLHSDLLAAISLRQLSYDLDLGLLTLLPIPLHDTRRVVGITRRTESAPSPGATLLMEEIVRRRPPVLTATSAKTEPLFASPEMVNR